MSFHDPTDPRDAGGDLAGPDLDIVGLDRAVLLDFSTGAIVSTEEGMGIGLPMAGRINLTQDHAKILYLMPPETAAALCAGVAKIIGNAPPEVAERFAAALLIAREQA
jgi:hypothetical protein